MREAMQRTMNSGCCWLLGLMAATIFHALALAARTGCSMGSEALLETSENSQEFHPAVSIYESGFFDGPDEDISLRGNRVFVKTTGTVLKHRHFAAYRLLLRSIMTAIVAAVAFLVLRCARALKVKDQSKRWERFLAEGGSSNFTGTCDGGPDNGGDKKPLAGGGVETELPVEQSVSHVLHALKSLARNWAAFMRTQRTQDFSQWWMRFGVFMTFELAALAALLEGPMEAERKAAAGEVVQVIGGLLEKGIEAERNRERRRRSRKLRRLLETVRDKDLQRLDLLPAQRDAKLRDLVEVQKAAVNLAAACVKELMSPSEAAESRPAQPLLPSWARFRALLYRRKKQLYTDDVFHDVLEALQLLGGHKGFFLRKGLLVGAKPGDPTPPPSEQIQELQMALLDEGESDVQTPQSAPPAGPHSEPCPSKNAWPPHSLPHQTVMASDTGKQMPSEGSLRDMLPATPSGANQAETPLRPIPPSESSPTSLRSRRSGPSLPKRHVSPRASTPQPSFVLPSGVTPFALQAFLSALRAPPMLLHQPRPFYPVRPSGFPLSALQALLPLFRLPVGLSVPRLTAPSGHHAPQRVHPPRVHSPTPPGAETAGAEPLPQTLLSPHATPFFPQKASKAPGAHRQKGKKFDPLAEGMPPSAGSLAQSEGPFKYYLEAEVSPESTD